MSDLKDFVIKNGVLTKYVGASSDVVIPEEVIKIKESAFFSCEKLVTVTIPNSVTIIGEEAFSRCYGLTGIIIGDGVKTIGKDAFSFCGNLEKIEVSQNNKKFHSINNCLIETESKTLVVGCKDSIIPDGVVSIGNAAFKGCEKLTTITIPNSIKSIGDQAFYACEELKNIYIPENVSNIGKRTFSSCKNLESIEVSQNNKKFHSINNCLIETETKTLVVGCKDSIIPDGVVAIGIDAFEGCKTLTTITIPDSVKSIESGAFAYCENLTEISIGNGVTGIGEGAFCRCISIKNISFPKSVTDFGDNMFFGCNLHRVSAPSVSIEIFKKQNLIFEATLGFFAHYKEFTDEITISDYKKYAFSQKKKLLQTIFEEDFVQGITFYANSGKITAQNIEKEFIAPALKAKSKQCLAFLKEWKKQNISQVAIKKALDKDQFNVDDMKKLWDFEKNEDGSLSIKGYKGNDINIAIPERIGKDAVVKIADEAFSAVKPRRTYNQIEILKKIQSISIPDSVISIGNSAFSGCESLKRFTIPNSVISIGDSALLGCKKIENIIVPGSVTILGRKVFGSCTGLASINIENGVTIIPDSAFENCKKLGNITLPDSVTSIDSKAFYGCKKLTDITIPKSVTSIAWWQTFKDCPNLTIHAPAGSYAEQYAKENNIPFVAE